MSEAEVKREDLAYCELTAKTRADDEAASDALVAWLQANGSKFPLLYFEYIAVDYRGVCINADAADDTILLEVSPECLMTIEVAKASDIGQQIQNSGCSLRSTHSYVASFILCEREKGADSFWSPYIDIMPKSYRQMPVFFDEAEMTELKGSLCVEEIEYRKDSYETVCYVLKQVFGVVFDIRNTSNSAKKFQHFLGFRSRTSFGLDLLF
jgi:hypothetical protein